jgi:phage terminase large subunit
LPEVEAQAFHGSGEIVDKDLFFIEPVGDAMGVTNGQYFSNYKAQSWWSLRERFRKTYQAVVNNQVFDADELISIDSECSFLEDLKEELSNPKSKKGSRKFTVDKAPDGVASPNLADSVMMAYAPQQKPDQFIFEV